MIAGLIATLIATIAIGVLIGRVIATTVILHRLTENVRDLEERADDMTRKLRGRDGDHSTRTL